jgi:hypothetical protein
MYCHVPQNKMEVNIVDLLKMLMPQQKVDIKWLNDCQCCSTYLWRTDDALLNIPPEKSCRLIS